ncbi:MAG: gluconeogenesis factor YvcK family protein [Succiniclasticum sp.]|jgi:uncharacterized cofD-like protein
MNWISWLCPGMNLKRWLLLFSGGVLCCAFSLALLFNDQTIGFVEEMLFRMSYMTTGRYNNGLMIAAGIVSLAAGLIIMFYATRRIVRSVMDAVLPENNGSLMETIFTQRKLSNGPAVTVVGGGTGLSTLLRGMKYITGNCTAVVTVADDGGSSGRLRQELGIIPPGDLRNCLVAMADREPLMERVMQYRFKGDSALAGHSLGNLFLAAIAETEGGMEEGLKAASQILKIRGHVIPSTLSNIQIRADMADGTSVLGESEITNAGKKIVRLHMVPADAPATKSAVQAIRDADVLIFGPGSLYTSVLPNLLVPGIREAVLASKAFKIYICNVMTQPGETDGYGAYDHVKALIDHVGKQFLDYVIVNDQDISDEQKRMYRAKGQEYVTPDIQKIEQLGIKPIPTRLISKEDMVRHDPQKLAMVLISLIYRLRLFGRGYVFFDYLFVRLSMRRMRKNRAAKQESKP